MRGSKSSSFRSYRSLLVLFLVHRFGGVLGLRALVLKLRKCLSGLGFIKGFGVLKESACYHFTMS